MTAEQPKEHCEHQCVCPDYKASTDQDEENPCNIACLDDTRSRPHPAPAQMPAPRKECVCFTCPDYGLADDCDPECPTLKQHQAIARQARDDALDALGKEICDRFHLKPRPYDPNDCEIPQIGLDELAEIIDAVRESLRGARSGQEEGR